MIVTRILAIIVVCHSMCCYATDVGGDVVWGTAIAVTPTNSAKYGVAVETSTTYVGDYSVRVACQNSVTDSYGILLKDMRSVFSVELRLESKAESLSLVAPVHYDRENGSCLIQFSMSRRALELSTLYIYYGVSRQRYIALYLPLAKWVDEEKRGALLKPLKIRKQGEFQGPVPNGANLSQNLVREGLGPPGVWQRVENDPARDGKFWKILGSVP